MSDSSTAPGAAGSAADNAPTPPSSARRRLVWLLACLAAGVLILDQVTKVWAERSLTLGESVPLIGELLQLTLVYNPGAAFSLATGMTWVLTIVAGAVVVAVIRFARRLRSRGWAVALGLLLGGALGNLGDRLFREPGFPQGHVVDFIDYGVFVGNVADIAVVTAAGLIILLAMRGIGIDGERVSDARPQATERDEQATEQGSDQDEQGSDQDEQTADQGERGSEQGATGRAAGDA